MCDESGSVYGRLTGITANTMRTDIVRLLEGCGVTLEDVKVEHNRLYYPIAVYFLLLSLPCKFSYAGKKKKIIFSFDAIKLVFNFMSPLSLLKKKSKSSALA